MYQKRPHGDSPVSMIGAGIAGAYHAANGDHDRAVRYFAGGYYYVAKRQRQEMVQQASFEPQLEPNGNPQPMFGAVPHRKLAQHIRNARAQVLGR